MLWFKVDKNLSVQPNTGHYPDWKPQLAHEAQHKCVYCSIFEGALGGIRNFHVEHYKPKSLPRFRFLENNIRNLFYACPICNTFKGDDWPRDPNPMLSLDCYPDPSQVDYNSIFLLQKNAEIAGLNVAAKYMVEKLFLNRPHLVTERKRFLVESQLKGLEDKFNHYIPILFAKAKEQDATAQALIEEWADKQLKLTPLLRKRSDVIPYSREDISR